MHTLHLPHWSIAVSLRNAARALAGAWAFFWLFYGLPFGGITIGHTTLHPMIPGLAFVALFLAAWRWEFVGGSLLVLAGLHLAVYYPLYLHSRDAATVTIVTLGLAAPPLSAGLLQLCGWGVGRRL